MCNFAMMTQLPYFQAYTKMIEKLPADSTIELHPTKRCEPVGPDHVHDGEPDSASTYTASLLPLVLLAVILL